MEDPDMACPPPAMEDPDPDPTSLQEAMEVPVTASLGPVGPLLRKLYYIVPRHLEVRPLMLLCMSLKDTSEDEEEASIMSRWWMKIVRELCYDAEDHLDEVAGGSRAGGRLDFSELLARAKDASERRQRFQWSPQKKTKAADLTSPELPVPVAIYGRSTVAVEPPKNLVNLLDLDDNDDDKQTPKVISISGCAGIGKTTVARTLYHNHGRKFECRAFMTASRNPDMRAFLTSMLSQLKVPLPGGFPDVPDFIDAVSKHLQGKRYFIVVDDLWTASVWDIISSAFPCDDHCSRIITTTQIDDVALASCSYDSRYIYKMELLDDDQSRKLFFRRVFGSQDGCPAELKEVSHDIVRKCGRLPLTIVNIASLFASDSNIVREKWKHVQDALPSTSDGMKDVINLMYNSLPHRLRTCLLYLSMYPGGYVIRKDELVKQLVAEGFLSVVVGGHIEEIAEGYFDELVRRGMVQPVDIDNSGEVLSCTVHQMVLDFIRHKSMEDNFIITVDYFQLNLALPEKVRRLSIQFGGVKSAYMPESIVTSHVRSLIFWGFFKCVPCITNYGLLRVLVLHIWADQDKKSFDLTTIGKLFQLKYLKIQCNITVKLPGKIRRLQYLGTLQVEARLSAVPSDIVNLKRLLHLCIPNECILPRVVGQLASLHTLAYFDISNHSEEDVLHLGGLTNLQDLQLTCSVVQPEENLKRNVQHLASILDKLSALQSLTLVPAASGSTCVNILEDGFSMASPPTPDLPLRKIELSRRCCIFFSLPKWFGELRNLCILKIAIGRLSRNDIDMLKGLPALTALTLHVQTVSKDKMVIDVGGFHVLTYFKFMCATPCLSFELGAMPRVQKLTLCFNANQRRSHTFGEVALSHLTALTEVLVKLGVRHADDVNIKGAESALADTFKYHPNTVMLRVECVDVIVYCEFDKSTTTQEVNKKITDIEEDKKEIIESSEKHVSNLWQVDSRYYVRPDLVSFLEHHTASVSVDLMTGSFGSILRKLSDHESLDYKLLEYMQLRGSLSYSTLSIRKELEGMQADLQELAKLEPAELDDETRMWANEVREFPYDVENAIDSVLREAMMDFGRIARTDLDHPIVEIIETVMKIRRIGKPIVDGIAAKRKASKSRLGHHTDQWLHPQVQDLNSMVGVEVSRDEVIGMLKHGTSAEATKQPKIVSIFGIAGLGKTTLAEAVYDRIKEGYTYSAFVSVSRNPDMKKVFMEILLQLDKQKHSSLSGGATVDATQLVGVIRGLLANKRYFFVVDDIWHEESWEVIKNILIENEHDNVVVTTTRILDVAAKANEVYELRTLSHSHSEELFNTRLFGGKGHIPSGVPKEESETLVRACGGVPLAIITMAVLLAGKPIDCWSKVRKDWFSMCKSTSFSDKHQGNDDIEDNTRAILLLIYYELPIYLRTFLLHLSIFPDNYAIQKETLIWKWVAEGLVHEELGEEGLFEKGDIIFGELIHTSLIMPIVDTRRQVITGCRLHGLVLDMIRTLSRDMNFVTVLDGNKQPNPTDPEKRKKMHTGRRIAVQMGPTEKGDPLLYTAPEGLRSFYATGFHFVTELPLENFGVVRVLALEECTLFKGRSYHLNHLGKLHMLRYLGLHNTPIDKLPEEISDLIYLQTLDLRGTTVEELPWGVAHLRKLKCMRTDKCTAFPNLHLLTSLQELRLGNVGFSEGFARRLATLTELRELEIWIEKLNEYEIGALSRSMRTLRKIKVLRLLGVSSSSSSPGEPTSWEYFYLPRDVRELHISTTLFSLPLWIDSYFAPMLSHLSVNVGAMKDWDLYKLGSLPELISLELLLPSHIFPTIMGGDAFPKLRCFNTSTTFSFSEGAMPRLEFLHFKVDVQALKDANVNFDDVCVASTLKNLLSLQKVEVEIISTGDVQAIHAALKRAVFGHPNSPSLHVVKTDLVDTMDAPKTTVSL